MLTRSLGRDASIWLMLAAAALLMIDTGSLFAGLSSHGQGPAVPVDTTTTPVQREMLLEQYRVVAGEIQSRIEQESVLFALKFTLAGSILAVLVTTFIRAGAGHPREGPTGGGEWIKHPSVAAFLWAAVLTSAIVDTRIQFHVDLIIALGGWVRNVVEPALLGTDLAGWETYLADRGPMESTIYPLLRANAVLLTLVLFAFTVLVFRTSAGQEPAGNLVRRICQAGSAGSFVVFWMVGIHYHYQFTLWILICVAIAAAGITAGWYHWSVPRL